MKERPWEDLRLRGISLDDETVPASRDSRELVIRKRELRKKINLSTSNSERKELIEEEVELNKIRDGISQDEHKFYTARH